MQFFGILAIVTVVIVVAASVAIALGKSPKWFTKHQTFFAAVIALISVFLAGGYTSFEKGQADERFHRALGQAFLAETAGNLAMAEATCNSEETPWLWPRYEWSIYQTYRDRILELPHGHVVVTSMQTLQSAIRQVADKPFIDNPRAKKNFCSVSNAMFYMAMLNMYFDLAGHDMSPETRAGYGIPLQFPRTNFTLEFVD